jgi:hypothetical protein
LFLFRFPPGCGGCCDVRRATIIVNIINLVMGLLGMILLATVSNAASTLDANDFDDDQMKEAIAEMNAAEMGGSIGWAMLLTVLRLGFNGLGIYGALYYIQWPVVASLAVFALEILFAMITFNFVGLIMFGFFAYPHVYLILEMRNGIMSEETYEIEKHSCCCV